MITGIYPEFLVFISVIFLSLYYTLLKKFPKHMMILYFWLHTISYTCFSIMYLIDQHPIPFHIKAIEQLLFDTTYTNFPLYILSGLCLLGTYVILDKLIQKYPIPKVLALAQISLVFSTAGYIILGDKTTTISLIGITIIFIGAIISGIEHFSWKNPLKCFGTYDKNLLYQSTIKALFYATTVIITYICTARYNIYVKHILYVFTKHMHFIPFTAIAPLHFNIGVQFGNLVLMFIFIKYYLKEADSIISIFKNNYHLILPITGSYILYAYFYYLAFDMIENKNIITALSKLYLPLTLIFCYISYKQKVSQEQIIGMTIIALGSIISIFG